MIIADSLDIKVEVGSKEEFEILNLDEREIGKADGKKWDRIRGAETNGHTMMERPKTTIIPACPAT